MSPHLTQLLAHTYRRSDLVYRLSLVREYAEYALFTEQHATPQVASIDTFCAAKEKTAADADFLHKLPSSFFSGMTSTTVYALLDAVRAEIETLPLVSLVVPTGLSTAAAERIGTWVRAALAAPNALLEVSVDPTVVAGCRVVWQNQRHDLSFERALVRSHAAIVAQVHARLSAHA